MPMSSRRLFLSLLLLPLPNLVAHADPSPISRAFQVQAVAPTQRLRHRHQRQRYDLGTLSFGTLGNLASPVNVASSSGAGSIVLTCTPGMTVSVALDYGVNGGSSSQRYLKR